MSRSSPRVPEWAEDVIAAEDRQVQEFLDVFCMKDNRPLLTLADVWLLVRLLDGPYRYDLVTERCPAALRLAQEGLVRRFGRSRYEYLLLSAKGRVEAELLCRETKTTLLSFQQ